MKRKKEYSLTAKERKALRKPEEEKKERKEEPQNPATDEILPQTESDAAVAPMSKRNIWIMIACIVCALIVILTAVLLLVLPRADSKYPRATIELSNGQKLTMTIWEEECPIAATNFIFLAKIGFFDGTIIYDVQASNNYMRFGAYKEDYGTRYEDKAFISGIPQKMFNIVNVDDAFANRAESNKFGYRLQKDKSSYKDLYGDKYVVSFNYTNSADYVINLGANNGNFYSGTTNLASNLVAFGRFEDDGSQEVLDSLMALNKNPDPMGTGSNFTGTDPVITIRKVTIKNENKKKWKNFEFFTYMQTAYDGTKAIRSWVA